MNLTLAAGASTSMSFTFPENFSAPPDSYLGNIVSGAGGWAEVIMSISNVSSSGGTLYINNPRSTSWSPNSLSGSLPLARNNSNPLTHIDDCYRIKSFSS